jgi:hypothetical protein
MTGTRLLILLALLASAAPSFSQAKPVTPRFGAINTFSVFGEYSNDSSHILLGGAEDRKLLNFGAGYSRRLFTTRFMDFRYMAELRPVVLVGDPLTKYTIVQTAPPPTMTFSGTGVTVPACHAFTESYSNVYQGVTYAGTETITCSRQWTYGQGLSPAGIKLNFLPRNRIQPVFTASGGYIFTTKPVPVSNAGSANYTFEFGVGLEIFHSATRSLRAEYRYNHISNNYTATENPGIDNGVLQISWSFGR